MAEIRVHRENDILILTFDNEPKRNAFTYGMTAALGRLLDEAEVDRTVRCVVLTGSGDKAFSSGHDLNELLVDRDHAASAELNGPFFRPASMTTPTIAAVNGAALAGGLILALSCDVRICSQNAVFAAPGAKIGLLPIGGQLSRLPALLPPGIAFEVLATARNFSAEEGQRHGFVNRIVPPDAVLDAALTLARTIAANSPTVVASIKRGLDIYLRKGVAAAEQFEWDEGGRLQGGPDADEGVRAFLEKRVPVFQPQ